MCGNMAIRLHALLPRALNTPETRRNDPRSHLRAAMLLPLQHNGAYWSGVTAPLILNLGTRQEWSPSRPERFTTTKSALGTH